MKTPPKNMTERERLARHAEQLLAQELVTFLAYMHDAGEKPPPTYILALDLIKRYFDHVHDGI